MGMTAFAQEKEEEKVDCSSVVLKHLNALTDATVREQKPRGACALARWGVKRHQELLRSYGLEPEECRKSDLGKELEKTLKTRISQETRETKKSCKRG
jgi:hypothetical protein